MSYARWAEPTANGDSDVYVYEASVGDRSLFMCQWCPLLEPTANPDVGPDDFRCQTREELLAHLERHRDAGHEVPERAFKRLRAEIEGPRK